MQRSIRVQLRTSRKAAASMVALLDEIPALVATLLPDGRTEFANRQALEFYGPSLTTVELWSEFLHPEDRDRFTREWRESSRNQASLQLELRMRRADGDYRWMDSRLRPLHDEQGRVVRWLNLLIDVDDRKQAEQAARASEQDLRLILDSIPGFVHTLTPTGEVEVVNKRILDFFGLPAEALRDWTRVTHPDDIERVGLLLAHSLRTGEMFEAESRGRRADGVYRWLHARGMPLRDESGTIIRWYHVLTDVDDRKRAEESLRSSEQNLRLIVDSISALICTSTRDGAVEYVNKPLLDYTGKSLDELRDWPVVVHPDDLPAVAQFWGRSIATGAPFNVEVRVRRADGAYRWFLCRGLPLRADDGEILRWYSVLTDIEDRKTAEQLMTARERDMALIVETMPAHVWCAGPDGALTYVNSRILSYAGATYQQLADAPFDYIHPDDRDRVIETWTEALRTGESYLCQYRMRRADGEFRWVQSLGQLGKDEAGRPARWHGLVVDIDDFVNMENALRDARARLARATQVATVGELSASIAHEINQPLAAVLANAHACHKWLAADPPNIARALLSLDRIIRDGRSAADVIQRIRSLYRHSPPTKGALRVNEVIEEVCQLMATEFQRLSIALRMGLQASLPRVLADRVQLQQVMSNLLRNAIEAMDHTTGRERALEITSAHEADMVVVHVRDTGDAMDDFSRAFDPFFTTKPQGMGMGLAISRSIVEMHGGRLWATRATPHGSIFSFSLPCAQGELEDRSGARMASGEAAS
jgi:PAS domain S-box-containing protein